ncbi:MAG: hypothetical protein ACE37E_08440 [Hyphomicrobiales bacterium]
MNVLDRLSALSVLLEHSDIDEFRSELIDRAENMAGSVPVRGTIYDHFKLTRKRKRQVEPAAGAKPYTQNEDFVRLVDNYAQLRLADSGRTYKSGYSLGASLHDFVVALNLRKESVFETLSANDRDLVNAFSVFSLKDKQVIPPDMLADELKLKELISPFAGAYALYRAKADKQADIFILEEKIEIYFEDTARIRYSDHEGNSFEGTLIFSRSKLYSHASNPQSTIDNFSFCQITIFTEEIEAGAMIVNISRSTQQNRVYTLRGTIEPRDEGFSPRFGSQEVQKYGIKYFAIVSNYTSVIGNRDSSFVTDAQIQRARVVEEDRLRYKMLLSGSKVKTQGLTLSQLYDKLSALLERRGLE